MLTPFVLAQAFWHNKIGGCGLMKIYDILNSKECNPLFEEIKKFVDISLSDYNKAIEENGFCYSDKDIFDFVWGTVNFSSAEICVLDSPLLQRLRRIRQLGLASMVYCNADSSRFSHTIGVTEVASRMAHSIKNKINPVDNSFDPIEIVRLAAIFHDTGHMFYSHVSELFFTYNQHFPRYKELTTLKTYFCEKTSSNVALHEIISVMIVYSPETLRLFKNISPHLSNTRLRSDSDYYTLAEYISCLIIGSPVDKFILPYSTIINSSIDADKLDYLSRDSACTKVPIAVDIARIIQKLDIVHIKEVVPSSIWNDISLETEPYQIMAIKSSAKKVFWQLSNARNSLFESVYHHHKVLTAENMFREALGNLYNHKENINFCDLMLLTDEIFNEYWKFTPLKTEDISEERITVIDDTLKRIRERALYKRVAVFSFSSLDGKHFDILQFFRNVIQNPTSQQCQEFKIDLTKEYWHINSILQNGSFISDHAPVFMFISAKYDALSSMPFESGDGYCTWSSALMKNETMEAGKKSRQEQFYLVSDCTDRDIVYLALEKILAKRNITFKAKDSIICLKIKWDELDQKRKILLEKNYYKDTLYIINDNLFSRLLNKSKIDTILKKYQSFTGVDSCKITKENILAFLRQFLWLELEYEELVSLFDGLLELLKNAYYIERETFVEQMESLLNKLSSSSYSKKHIVNLGNFFDSSKHLMYYFNDLSAKNGLIIEDSLETSLSKLEESECLYFFDDGAYSGKQVISIFQELMGVPVEKRTTNEHHADELNDENKAKLKKAHIVLSYLCFNSSSKEYIISELNNLGLEFVDIIYVEDLNQSALDKTSFKSPSQKELVTESLRSIGFEIMKSRTIIEGKYKERWNEERVSKAALGYNDAQQMVFFSTNVPTYTITAFWQNGTYKGNKWKGLFQRTVKD